VDPKQLLAAVQGCAKSLMKGYDPKLGGFGGPPKFPRPSEINLLLRAATEQVRGVSAHLEFPCVLRCHALIQSREALGALQSFHRPLR
jgi:hypothetical protein